VVGTAGLNRLEVWVLKRGLIFSVNQALKVKVEVGETLTATGILRVAVEVEVDTLEGEEAAAVVEVADLPTLVTRPV